MHHAEQTFLLRSSSSAHELKEKLTQARTWAWKHRKGIIIAVTGTAGMIFLVRKRSAIKELLRSLGMEASAIEPIVTSLAEKKISAIPVDVLDHRTGVMLTATKLGNKVGVSNREINRRLIDAGLLHRLPCGECILTDDGKLLGEVSLKVTSWNKTVRRIQWDEAVLNIIFGPEELVKR